MIELFFYVAFGLLISTLKFFLYAFVSGFIILLPLLYAKGKVKKNSKSEKALSGFIVFAAIGGGIGSAILYSNETKYVYPLVAKIATYSATELTITFNKNISDNARQNAETFLLEYFNNRGTYTFHGGSSYARGGQLRRAANGYLDNYWKKENRQLSFYFSIPLNEAESKDLKKRLNIWFNKQHITPINPTIHIKPSPGTPHIFASILKLRSQNYTYKPTQDDVVIDPSSLDFRDYGDEIFRAGMTAPSNIPCYAIFDIKKGILEEEVKRIVQKSVALEEKVATTNARLNQYLKTFSTLPLDVNLSNNKHYDAHITSLQQFDEITHSHEEYLRNISKASEYKQYLVLTLVDVKNEDLRFVNYDKCKKFIQEEEPLYDMYIKNMYPTNTVKLLESVQVNNIAFSPFYESGVIALHEGWD